MIITCWLITLVLESIMLLILRERKIIIFAFMAFLNTFTNLSINGILILISPNSNLKYYLWIAVLEIAVLIIEGLLLYLYTKNVRKSTQYSVCCNLFSYIAGTLIVSLLF